MVNRTLIEIGFLQFSLMFCQKKDSFESVVMEHLRLNGAYWGLATLDILGKLDAVDEEDVISWILKCQDESGLYRSFFPILTIVSLCVNNYPICYFLGKFSCF